MKKEHLIIAAVFAVIIIIASVIIGTALYEPPEEFEIYTSTAEVVRYDEELDVVLIREEGVVKELRLGTAENLVVFSETGEEISVKELQPGQQIRFYREWREWPDISPRSPEAKETYWYCFKIEVM